MHGLHLKAEHFFMQTDMNAEQATNRERKGREDLGVEEEIIKYTNIKR